MVETTLSEAEQLQLYEQMFLASLDMKMDDKANTYLDKLSRQLSDCGRVQRLKGMQLEAKGDYDGAIALYDRLLQENPANISVLQRTAATYKAQGNFNEALSELNKIVELNSADATVWNEIADIHIRLSNYDEAAFCLEEVVLLDPNNHLTQSKLGDLYYSMGNGFYPFVDYLPRSIGGLNNFLKARRHYTASLNILKGKLNVRALYALSLCCQNIAEEAQLRP